MTKKNKIKLRGDHTAILMSKCLPLLLYALEVCNLTKRDLQSLNFTIIYRFFMELLRTNDINVVTECQLNFHLFFNYLVCCWKNVEKNL